MRTGIMRGIFGLVLILGVLSLGACNTVHGMGQDIQDASDAVRKAF